MRERIDKGRPQPVAFTRSLRARSCLDGHGPRQGDSHLRRYGGCNFARQVCGPPCHRTYGAHPHHQRMGLKSILLGNCCVRAAGHLAQICFEELRQLCHCRHKLIPILHVQNDAFERKYPGYQRR